MGRLLHITKLAQAVLITEGGSFGNPFGDEHGPALVEALEDSRIVDDWAAAQRVANGGA